MSTLKQIEANRNNARLSTGPITPEGKAKSSMNSTKHGILSAQLVLDTEDPEEFARMHEDMWAALQPVGELEEMHFETIVASRWRLRRVRAAEKGLFEGLLCDRVIKDTGVGTAFLMDSRGTNAFTKLLRYESAIDRALQQGTAQSLQRLQAERVDSPQTNSYETNPIPFRRRSGSFRLAIQKSEFQNFR